MKATGDLYAVDSTGEYLIISGDEYPDGQKRIAASEINSIKYGGGWKPKYILARMGAGFILATFFCNNYSNETGWRAIEDKIGIFWGCFSAGLIGGVALSITEAAPREIKCSQ